MAKQGTKTQVELKPGQISREQYAQIGEWFTQKKHLDAVIRACIGDRMVNGMPHLKLISKNSELELSQHMEEAAYKAIAEIADQEREDMLTLIRSIIPDWQ